MNLIYTKGNELNLIFEKPNKDYINYLENHPLEFINNYKEINKKNLNILSLTDEDI